MHPLGLLWGRPWPRLHVYLQFHKPCFDEWILWHLECSEITNWKGLCIIFVQCHPVKWPSWKFLGSPPVPRYGSSRSLTFFFCKCLVRAGSPLSNLCNYSCHQTIRGSGHLPLRALVFHGTTSHIAPGTMWTWWLPCVPLHANSFHRFPFSGVGKSSVYPSDMWAYSPEVPEFCVSYDPSRFQLPQLPLFWLLPPQLGGAGLGAWVAACGAAVGNGLSTQSVGRGGTPSEFLSMSQACTAYCQCLWWEPDIFIQVIVAHGGRLVILFYQEVEILQESVDKTRLPMISWDRIEKL